jgi:ubiquinone/menaquinone biosynthesis C-methylase UbiE
MNTNPQNYLHTVRNQYEALPYPYRNPEVELENLPCNDAFSLDAFNHYGWGGMRDFRNGLRVLIAGQGTGDSCVYFAEQLRDMPNTEIIGLDISQASIDVSKARLAKRRITTVKHVHASLLDLPKLGLGKFDIIDCGGVLHHLADPDAGLRALQAVLADDGMMGIMVYAQYGRMALYMVQDLMRRITPPDMDAFERVQLCREFLSAIPQNHWMTFNNDYMRGDLQEPSGAGIYDLFLHSQDRAYTVPQLYEWVEGAQLKILSIFGAQIGEELYHPERYTQSAALRAQFATKSRRERFAIGELMHGHIPAHFFYAAHTERAPATLRMDMVPVKSFVRSRDPQMMTRIATELQKCPLGNVYGEDYPELGKAASIQLMRNPLTHVIIGYIDGMRSVGDIMSAAIRDGAMPDTPEAKQQFTADMNALFTDLHRHQALYLRHQSIAPYITAREIQERAKTFKA